MYLLIKARVEDRYNSGRLSLSIGAIQLLQEEKDRLIEKISITVPIHDLDEPTINELSTLIKNNPGQSLLYFKVVDCERCRQTYDERSRIFCRKNTRPPRKTRNASRY